jgi:imidazolonepropionase-like amidohydrolase
MKIIYKHVFRGIFILLILSIGTFAQENQQAILAGNLIDVGAGKIRKNVLIIIENDRIVKITNADEKAKFPNLIDLSEYTVLPGLIDCHTHLTDNSYDKSYDVYELPIASYGIIGTLNAKRTLEAGFTNVRDLGSWFYSDVALRDAINKGWIQGPRMYVSGTALTITGGHGAWGNWMSSQIELKQNPGAVVDGADEIRKEVRLHIKNKVNLIKLNATGGFGTSGSIPGAASFSIEEIKTAVEEAKKNGLKVAAHAHGADGIKNAVKAGVHSIEHGSLMDDESIELMKKHNVYLVMDILAAHYDLIEVNKEFTDKKLSETNQELYKQFIDNFLKAHNQGVKMAFGSDSGVYPHGRNAEQFELMQKAGMKPADILKTATINAAELIGIEKNSGSIEVGKWADIIAVKGNPLEDVSVLEKVSFVMKGGKVFKQR